MGEEQYSPRGKLYLLQIMDQIESDPELAKEFRRLLFQCAMCGRCTEVCSSDVDLLKVWHEQRAKAIMTAPGEFAYLDALEKSLGNVKNIYGLSPDDRAIYWLDELEPDIPGISERVFAKGKKAEVVVFLGCLMSFRASQVDVLRALFKSLEILKVDYLVLGAEEFCCGHPLDLMGDPDSAKKLRTHNKRVIKQTGAKQVVTCCPGCLSQLQKNYNLTGIEVLHHTQFFDRLLESFEPYKQTEDFTYHDPCELHRICNVKVEPRSLLKKMGVQYRELDLSCCGGGGLLRMTDPNLSDKIQQLRAARERLSNTTVITACPACREQLLGNNLKTKDIVELLVTCIDGGTS
jgi:Fe-S oxidoreductase